jgi:hypothetical protein
MGGEKHIFYGKGSPKGELFAGRDMAGNMRCGNHNIYGKGSPNGEHFAGRDMAEGIKRGMMRQRLVY